MPVLPVQGKARCGRFDPYSGGGRLHSQDSWGEDAMRRTLYLLVFVLALSLAYATSQTSGSSSGTTQTPVQSQPPGTTGQTTPTTAPTGATPTTPDTQSAPGAGTTATSGSDLQAQIQNALRNEPTLANDNVNVIVSDSEIDLSGAVATGKEKLTAKRIVQSYAGNRKVKEHLTLASQDNTTNSTRSNENPASNTDNNGKPAGNKPPRN